MSHVFHRVMKSASTVVPLERLVALTAPLLARGRERARSARASAVLDQLDDAQLRDAGLDRWAGRPPRPVLRVKAGLTAILMSLR